MEIQVDNKICYYSFNGKKLYVGVVFEYTYDNGNWFADSYDGSPESDYFSDKPFKTKEQAIEHIDQTMKAIFKRILDEQ